VYLFPGSLIGYFFYGDIGKQPNLISNPFGTSINHFFYFLYLSILAIICNLEDSKIFTKFYFLILISIFLEVSHFIIPNRAFETYDLLANITGVLSVFLFKRLIS
tara:strand:+ start:242 stop:556 length:315 start_codon:yes stop_codon:yes gene_type:complete